MDSVVAYYSNDVTEIDPEVLRRFDEGGIDWETVASSATAGAVVDLFGDRLRQCRIASISPITSEALLARGIKPAAEATRYTMHGLCEAIVEAVERLQA